MNRARIRGDAVERAARMRLVAAGLEDVAAQAGYRVGELDLVMRDPAAAGGACLVFVEVRYRRTTAFGSGADSVDARKRRRIVRAARAFLAAHPRLADMPCRFDVVEATGAPDAPTLHWIRDAFRADD